MKTPQLKLHILKSDKRILPFVQQITSIAKETFKQVNKLLPFKEPVDIVVYRYIAHDPEFATSGYTPTGNVLWIYTDPTQKEYKKLLQNQLTRVLSHELHHACRIQYLGMSKTLQDALVFEGLAAHFESEITAQQPSQFYTQFDNKKLRALLLKARSDINNEKYSYDDWFFGNNKRNIPKHAGYGMSYFMVEEALKGRKPSELVNRKTGQIL